MVNLDIAMMDYEKSKLDAVAKREALTLRQREIAAEKAKLDEESAAIQRQLIGLDQIIEGLDVATLQAPPDLEPIGFTEHIKNVLQNTTVHLLPTQIRDSCLNAGFTGSSLKNLLISVHNVLDRIHDNLDEKQVEGKKAYKWKTTIPTPAETLRRIRRHAPNRGIFSSQVSIDAVNSALKQLGMQPITDERLVPHIDAQGNLKQPRLLEQITKECEELNKKPKGG
jgi:hypothetical protein